MPAASARRIASAVGADIAASRPIRSSTNAGFLPSYQWPTNWITQPTAKKPTPQASQLATLPPETSWPSLIRMPTPTLTAMPRTTLPRVRYHAAARAKATQARVSETPKAGKVARARSTPTAKTIIGTPMKWLTMLRRSRWYSAYWARRSVALRRGGLEAATGTC